MFKRYALLLSALLLMAACSSSIAGSPTAVSTVSSAGSSSLGPITEPTVAPAPVSTPGSSAGPSSSSARSSGGLAPATPTGATATSSPPAATSPSAPVRAGLAKFYGQQLAWGSCSSFADSTDMSQLFGATVFQCARLTVPLAYADPTGQTVTMGVLRKVATQTSGRIGSLVIDPGGPGGSGMAFVAQEVAGAADPKNAGTFTTTMSQLGARFDLVGIDPRGVGSALPAVQCQTDAHKDAARTKDTRSRTQSEVDAANQLTRARVADCVANTGKSQGIDGKAFLANIGTRDVARDLDVLRAALGDSTLTYLGFSYGTKIGYEYAEQFPTHVRALLFDGDENPDQDSSALVVNEYKQFQVAFGDYAQWCAANVPTCALGTDQTKALPIYQDLVRPLLSTPVTAGGGRTLSFADATTGTTFALYFNELRPALAAALTKLKAGDGGPMMALADQYDQRDSKGHYSNELDVLDAVTCVDGPRTTDPAKIIALQSTLAAAAPYLATGDQAGALVDPCAVWPVPPTLLPHKLKITGLPKTLVVSTTGDPATPYADGVELAKELGASLLTVKAVRHTSYLGTDQCANQIGTAYLLTLGLPAAGATCG